MHLSLVTLVIILIQSASCNEYDAKIATMAVEIEALKGQLDSAQTLLQDRKNSLPKGVEGKLNELGQKSEDHVKLLKEEMEAKFTIVEENYLKRRIEQVLSDVDSFTKKRVGATYMAYLKWLDGESAKWIGPNGTVWDEKHQWSMAFLKRVEATLKTALTKLKTTTDPLREKFEKAISNEFTEEEKIEKAKKLENVQIELVKLAKHIQAVQFHGEEKLRTSAQSGIKQIRVGMVGSENYHMNTHTGGTFSSIHDHSNNIRTLGMGEFIGVLNGAHFRTRHNDYRLYQPVSGDKSYHKTTNVEFPAVPKAVTDKPTVEEQITEMREWFKAWVDQDHSVRDYRPYFKPVLAYLEGAWTMNQGDNIDEPFDSDRHAIDAAGWLELLEKNRFTSYTGLKSRLENLAYLPTKIIRFTDKNAPVFAQWNYRIACHPISKDIPTSFFEPRYDEAAQLRNRADDEQYVNSRAASFDIEGINISGERIKDVLEYTFLDSIMEEIPGKDNYGATIEGVGFNAAEDKLYSANPTMKDTLLNAAYYHRTYIQKSKSGLVSNQKQRAFSDRLYVAETTSDRIAYMSYTNSSKDRVNTRVSFAIPIEMIYLTPLHSWNPYNIPYTKEAKGTGTKDDPFTSVSSRVYYQTPYSFFSGEETDANAADTTMKGASYIKTPSGVKAVRASGTRIFFPMIEGIDKKIRQRYPIMPIHGKGSALWKKLNALEDAMKYDPEEAGGNIGDNFNYLTGSSHATNNAGHRHPVALDDGDYERLLSSEVNSIQVDTEVANGHSHTITVALKPGTEELYIVDCGTENRDAANELVCNDNHENTLTQLN